MKKEPKIHAYGEMTGSGSIRSLCVQYLVYSDQGNDVVKSGYDDEVTCERCLDVLHHPEDHAITLAIRATRGF